MFTTMHCTNNNNRKLTLINAIELEKCLCSTPNSLRLLRGMTMLTLKILNSSDTKVFFLIKKRGHTYLLCAMILHRRVMYLLFWQSPATAVRSSLLPCLLYQAVCYEGTCACALPSQVVCSYRNTQHPWVTLLIAPHRSLTNSSISINTIS